MDSTGAASVGEVLRRLGAEGSMLGGIWATSGHARRHGMRFASWSALRDASHCVVVNKDGRVRGLESLALQGVESQRSANAKQLIVYFQGCAGWVRPVSCATVRRLLLASTATCSHVPTCLVLRAQDLAGPLRVLITEFEFKSERQLLLKCRR